MAVDANRTTNVDVVVDVVDVVVLSNLTGRRFRDKAAVCERDRGLSAFETSSDP